MKPQCNRMLKYNITFLTVAEVAEIGSLETEISKGPIVPFPDDI
jgi:hypothetical protein